MENKKWYAFMATDNWVVFMNITRILLFVAMVILILLMVINIKEVKTIANPCKICAEKTGAVCMIRQDENSFTGLDLTNLTITIEP